MATFHRMEDDGRAIVRCLVKGAPDVLLARCAVMRGADGEPIAVDADRGRVLAENARLAQGGLRVLAVVHRDLDPDSFDAGADLLEEVRDLTLLALVGIVDPPRREARDAIARCKEAILTDDNFATIVSAWTADAACSTTS